MTEGQNVAPIAQLLTRAGAEFAYPETPSIVDRVTRELSVVASQQAHRFLRIAAIVIVSLGVLMSIPQVRSAVMEWIRWKLAGWVQQTQRHLLGWADLVGWAQHREPPLRELFPRTSTFGNGVGRCKREALRDGECYCAKFATEEGAREWQVNSPFIVTPKEEPEFERSATIRFGP